MKFAEIFEKASAIEAADDAVRFYKTYLVTKCSIWVGTLFVMTLIKKLTESDKSETK